MKMKKFISGVLAAIMSIAVIAAPVSAAGNDDEDSAKGKIIINHAAPSGTYTAYPIFVGNVEKEEDDEGKATGRLVIDTPMFHPNLETAFGYMSGNVIARVTENAQNYEGYYGLYRYLDNAGIELNGKTFGALMKEYDSSANVSINSIGGRGSSNKDAAEAIANLLNLTSTNGNSAGNIISGVGSAAFYSAFAEAAREFMVDKIADNPGTLTDVVSAAPTGGKAEIEVDKAGYYLVEYTPEGTDTSYDETPKAVRRALVLVGLGDDLSATINSKDTKNVASVDIQFNETLLVQGEDGTFGYGNKTEGKWQKNVSAGNGDYVNCRVVVTLPGNLEAYDQYYLAVPIMYGYNLDISAVFDGKKKSVTRVKGDDENPLQYIKVYSLDNDNGNKTEISNPALTIETTYTYADETTLTNLASVNFFKAHETFVISDIKKISGLNDAQKFCIEFPVKFERFDSGRLNDSAAATYGVSNLGYDTKALWGDDLLMKNYISAKLVYSNNPNLKALKEDETAYDKTDNTDGVKLYLDTTKTPGTLYNPVTVTKGHVSANIVTYRLRVHATTEDLVKICQAGGIEHVRFAIKNSEGKYAKVEKFSTSAATYDRVDGEYLRPDDYPTGYEFSSTPSSYGNVGVYKIIGWVDQPEDGNVSEDILLRTYGNDPVNGIYRNSNSARFEVVGIAPGDYTVVVLDEAIKTNDTYVGSTNASTAKEYKLPREGNKPKTDYRFSFNPELNQEIGKQDYNTHYAPASVTEGDIVVGTMIKNYNLKWYDGDTEIKTQPDWFLGSENNVGLMSMRVTYIKKGLTLPVTGGIGTLIFFAVGGALVVISTVTIVTKFRMKRERL